ncbi:histone-lysine N-methyltransferase SETMAR, partial [Trichonephila clavipes]
MPLDNKCRIGPLAGAPPDTCAVVISTETESGFITEDDTSPVCHTPSCPRSAKIQSTLPMMWGSVVSVLADVGSSSQLRSVVSLWFLLMALDVWKEPGCIVRFANHLIDLQSYGVAAVAEWYRYRIVAGFVTSSSPVPLKTRRVGQRCTLNLSRAETSSRWCGV